MLTFDIKYSIIISRKGGEIDKGKGQKGDKNERNDSKGKRNFDKTDHQSC